MYVVVHVASKDSAKAWGVLVRQSPATALRDRAFVISECAVKALRKAAVKFKEISRVPTSCDPRDHKE